MSPSVISTMRLTIRIAVVLPQPDGPTKTQISPAWTSRSSSFTAGSVGAGVDASSPSRNATESASACPTSPLVRPRTTCWRCYSAAAAMLTVHGARYALRSGIDGCRGSRLTSAGPDQRRGSGAPHAPGAARAGDEPLGGEHRRGQRLHALQRDPRRLLRAHARAGAVRRRPVRADRGDQLGDRDPPGAEGEGDARPARAARRPQGAGRSGTGEYVELQRGRGRSRATSCGSSPATSSSPTASSRSLARPDDGRVDPHRRVRRRPQAARATGALGRVLPRRLRLLRGRRRARPEPRRARSPAKRARSATRSRRSRSRSTACSGRTTIADGPARRPAAARARDPQRRRSTRRPRRRPPAS